MKSTRHLLRILLLALAANSTDRVCAQVPGDTVRWDGTSLIVNSQRVAPAMGEIHYSRIPAREWKDEVRKMKEGGISIIATYVFWNHIEEVEDSFDWSGQRDLRRFLTVCKEENMPVILRMGPFCHGEVRCGGIPDWMTDKKNEKGENVRLRSEDPAFLKEVRELYAEIYRQIEGLQWKDHGPLLACQFDNEYRGRSSYLLALKRIAQDIGFDTPFYTRTGWPELSTPMPYGEMIPLYGDYADGFWDRNTQERTGNYWKAFNFKAFRSSTAIATEQLGKQEEHVSQSDAAYPYFTCELGGGMATSYHRRIYSYPEDAYAMAVVKLGSGSNLLGYYMYHGGINPDGKRTTLNECQQTPFTNHNDLPVKDYDFQAPVGAFGQLNPHYYSLRKLHLFMKDFGSTLAPMTASFPTKEQGKDEDQELRWSYRKDSQGQAFIFINNYDRLHPLSCKRNTHFVIDGKEIFPHPIDIPSGCTAILPANLQVGHLTINYATVQLVARKKGALYFAAVEGIAPEARINGKLFRLQAGSSRRPACTIAGTRIYVLSPADAGHLFLPRHKQQEQTLGWKKVRNAGRPRTITTGARSVAAEPSDEDFEQAAVYTIDVPKHSGLLSISYRGDCARLYADGVLVNDNFYNGRPMLYGLWRLPEGCKKLELRILPKQQSQLIYFPSEADARSGAALIKVSRWTNRHSSKIENRERVHNRKFFANRH